MKQKLWGVVALLWVCLIVMVAVTAIMIRFSLLEQKKAVLAEQTQTALGIVAYYQKQAASGAITVDQAKHQTIETLRGLRYGPDRSGYFGLYDDNAIALLVPSKPELEGKSQLDMVDPQGTHIAGEIMKSSAPGGGHFSHYIWPKPGHTEPVGKITYADTVPDWGWRIFTGAYVDDIDATFTTVLLNNLVLIGVIGAIVTVGLLWLIRSIRVSLGGEPEYAADMCRQIAAGDLTARLQLNPGDTNSLLYAMSQMQQQLTDTVARIQSSAESITHGANEIAAGNADLSQRTEEQASALAESASSMEQLTATVKLNADNAVQASHLAQSASETVSDGGKVVDEVVQTIVEIAESSKKIEQIISVIDGIAFQTNILALNAAVEAARAGEQGRGFAVVAAEVRTLAQRSASAAKEIKALIDASVTNVERGQSLAGDAGSSMQAILQSVKRVTDIMGEISAASSEQSTGIGHVGVAIAQMDTVTQQNAALVEQATAGAASLAEQANQLKEAVAVFQL
ncbi:methyl-accepting chemotaxis protein [Pararobbsia silviterrae]|uniref:methyl-accepting chemotaxis protein n=1 Tax=Pararobbsia silviterrae TaxID=1792498 RepID=UPI0030B83CCF